VVEVDDQATDTAVLSIEPIIITRSRCDFVACLRPSDEMRFIEERLAGEASVGAKELALRFIVGGLLRHALESHRIDVGVTQLT
jgi:hypothetical protein